MRVEEAGKAATKEGNIFVRGNEQGKVSVNGRDRKRNLTGEVGEGGLSEVRG